MNANKLRSFMARVPSWALAAFWFILNAVLIMISGMVMMILNIPQSSVVADVFVWTIYDLLVAIGCYYIVKWNPKSIWYVPVICNFYGITGFIMVSDFRTTYLCILMIIGWTLSILASIIGYRIGKRVLSDHEEASK
jgi:CDP-diglyceride synthetase